MVLSTERTIVFEMTAVTEIFLLKVVVYLIAEVNTYERRKQNEYNRIDEMIGRIERASGVRIDSGFCHFAIKQLAKERSAIRFDGMNVTFVSHTRRRFI